MSHHPQRKISYLDVTAWIVIAFLAGLITLVMLIGNPLGLTVTLDQTTAGPRGPLTLTFSHPPSLDALSPLIKVSPLITGTLSLADPQTVEFVPNIPFQLGVAYTLSLSPGPAGSNGEHIRQAKSWHFTIRQPQVVFYVTDDNGDDLWQIGLNDGDKPQQLTFTEGRLFDFAASPDGEWLAYSATNDQRGVDLWLANRNGTVTRILVNCAKDRCVAPSWSSDSQWLGYSRQPAGPKEGDPPGAPRPWLAQASNGQTHPAFSDSQIIGYGACFSPDGRWLVTYDGIQGGLRVLDLQSAETTFFAGNTGMLPEWSPDGRYLLYTNTELFPGNPSAYHTVLYRADFVSGEAGPYFGQEDTRDFAYAIPAWSPTGKAIVIGMRGDAESFASQLWLIHPDQFRGPMIAAEPGYSYSSFHWDAWGQRLVMQRSDMNANYAPSIAVWDETGGLRVLVEGGRNPQWLP